MIGPRPHRILATLLTAVLWVWSATAGLSHHIGTRHVLCPEHGELVEVHGGVVGDHHVPGLYGAPEAEHQHDRLPHAILLAVRVPALLSAGCPHQDFAQPPSLVSRPPVLEILAFAPKLSPPRLG